MSDPITASLALGVAGNLATNVTLAFGSKLQDTGVGKALARLGLISPGFDSRLSDAIRAAVVEFLSENPLYALPEVFHFLESKSLARDVRDMLLEGRGLDATKLMARLENYIGVPLADAPDSWPNRIDPVEFSKKFFESFTSVLGESADEGVLWLGAAIAEQGITLRGVAKKLDQLLEARLAAEVGSAPGLEMDDFQSSYLQHLIGRAQRISTPGARELRGINQSLSVAYISLNLKSVAGAEAIRAETFLAQHSHVTIRGPAGSGKTTLLNWLVTKCNPDRDASIDDKWRGYVPFLIPLRKVARLHSGPPNLNRLVEYSVDEKLWMEPTPEGWISKVVSKQKRAILMIDGVDELPPSRRVEFWEWLAEFVEEYPQNRVIVTSRALPGSPADGAHSEQWNPPKVFSDAQLQDMSDADVTSFIHHWHDAIDVTKLDHEELSSLADARLTLPAKLEDAANRRIRELCNTPLLCAMICVLHWKEEGYLPRHRVEVYERCCDMLIEARDQKRGVSAPPGPIAAMSKSDKEMVLQQLAIEMMRNRDDSDSAVDDTYRIEIAKDRALEWIAPRIARFQASAAREATPVQVLDYLVERTGLLREPATDLIDFPHRTFQEYLAACAAGAESQEAMLARQADDDQWHETIMLAAGTNTGGVGFGRRLIEKLISRGEKHQSPKERSQRIRKTCFALALGCLENLRQQDEDLRGSVLSNLVELVPPRGDDDARILSVAGDAAVGHLSYSQWKDENTSTVAACARALRLIGTTEAIRALERGYLGDTRQSVVSEVCKAAVFPYAAIPVVAATVERTGALPSFVDLTDLVLLRDLRGLKEIYFDAADVRGAEYVSLIDGVRSVSIDSVNERADYLFELPESVEELRITGTALPSGDWMDRLKNLRDVTIEGLSEPYIERFIERVQSLSALSLLNSDFGKVDAINRIANVEQISLVHMSNVIDVGSLARNPSLQELEIEVCRNLTAIDLSDGFASLKKLEIAQPHMSFMISGDVPIDSSLEEVSLRSISGVDGLDFLRNATRLAKLSVIQCDRIASLSPLDDFESLQELDLASLSPLELVRIPGGTITRLGLSSVNAVTENSFASTMPLLNDVELERCVKLGNIDFVRHSEVLSGVRIGMMPRLSSLEPLKGKRTLTNLSLFNCDGIESLNDINDLELEELSLISMDNIVNFEAITSLRGLKSLDIIGCDGLRDLSFAADMPNLEVIRLHSSNHEIHVPESLRPKVRRGPSAGAMYHRSRRTWRRDDPWGYYDYRRSLGLRRVRAQREVSRLSL